MLQSLNHLCVPLLDSFQYVLVFIALGSLELDTPVHSPVLRRGEGLYSKLDGNAQPTAAKDTFFVSTLLTYVSHCVHHVLKVLFCHNTFQVGSLQHVLGSAVIPPQVQVFILPFAECHEVADSPLSSLAKSIWIAAQPFWISASFPGFESSTNLLWVHSV